MDAPRAPLTAVEQKLWQFLLDHLATHSFQPSVREIARHFRIPSTRTVSDLIESLERKGYLRRTPGRSRGVVLAGFVGAGGTQPVPVVHFTLTGAAETERHLTLDRALVPSADAYLVRANAEEAPRHAVREGDLLLVLPEARVPEENPVVARIGTRVLVRTLVRRGATLLLLAPAPGMRDIELRDEDDFRILGPLALVLRSTAAGTGDAEPD